MPHVMSRLNNLDFGNVNMSHGLSYWSHSARHVREEMFPRSAIMGSDYLPHKYVVLFLFLFFIDSLPSYSSKFCCYSIMYYTNEKSKGIQS